MGNLAPDRLLLHYRLVARLGRGGMGEIWRAVDTRLDREVAIKVLPDAVADDPEQLARLEREAKAVARLSHPNIIAVHAVEEVEGIRFVAMELVRGRTLAEIIPEDGLPFDRFIDIAVPLADAVAAAHRGGVTHRDIKPSNVMVTDDGVVKILDFGLAKLTGVAPHDDERTRLTTETIAPPGRIIGTAAYMSPEQAQGKPVDSRSDVFSLGVVLFEMLTGRQPFRGDTLVSLLSSIVKDTPPLVTESRSGLPGGAGRVVRRCLEKDPERRYQTAVDLRNDLEELREEAPAAVAAPGPGSRSSGRRLGAALIAIAVVAGAVAGAYLLRGGLADRSTAGAPVAPSSGMSIVPLTRSGTATRVDISPDGRYVVYVSGAGGMQSLRVRQLATGSDQEILAPAAGEMFGPRVSPDGEWVYYGVHARGGVLYRMPILGGHPQKILEGVDGEFDLSPDGARVVFLRHAGQKLQFWVVGVDGSDQRQVMEASGEVYAQISWSSDGKRIHFTAPDPGGLSAILRGVSIDDGTVTDLGEDAWQMFDMVTFPEGRGLLIAASKGSTSFQISPQLWLVQPGGEAVRLTHDIDEYVSPGVDRSGSNIVAIQRTGSRTYMILPDGDESRARRVAFTSRAGPYWCGIQWTPDGRLLYEDLDGSSLHVWITGPDGSGAQKLTRDGEFNMGATVSPDGKTVAYFSDRNGQFQIWLSDLDGGNARRLTGDTMVEVFPRFSPDGRWVVYHVFSEDGAAYVTRAPASGGAAERVIEYPSFSPAVSHDGRKLAFASRDETGDVVIIVTDLDSGEVITRFDHQFTSLPYIQWTPDDRGVASVGRTGPTGNIIVHPLDGGPSRQITHFTDQSVLGFSWSPDGSSLALTTGRRSSDVVLIRDFAPHGD